MNQESLDFQSTLKITATGQECVYVGHTEDGDIVVKLTDSLTQCVVCKELDLENVPNEHGFSLTIPAYMGYLDVACDDGGVMALGSNPALLIMRDGSHRKLFRLLNDMGLELSRMPESDCDHDARRVETCRIHEDSIVNVTCYLGHRGKVLALQSGSFWLLINEPELDPFLDALQRVGAEYDRLNNTSKGYATKC